MKKLFFLLICFCLHAKQKNIWEQMAQVDLNSIYQVLKNDHPGTIDKKNPIFKNNLKNEYKKVCEKLNQINSFEGYKYLLQFYISSFQDHHLSLQFDVDQESFRWPGFLLTYVNGEFIVNFNATHFQGKFPGIGSQLILCNGKHPNEIMKKNILPYMQGIIDLESDWFKLAPYLLIDMKNPWVDVPQKCIFLENGIEKEYILTWQPIKKYDLIDLIEKGYRKIARTTSLHEFGNNNIWITLPSFRPANQKAFDALQVVVNIMKELRSKNIIVFDVRGNSGGDARWVHAILTELYGLDFLEQYNKEHLVREYRLSHENISYMQKMAEESLKYFGKDSPQYISDLEMIDKMQIALKQGKSFYSDKNGDDYSKSKKNIFNIPNPVKATVFLLTDYSCGSACLNFVDVLLSIPFVFHIGLPTGADTAYTHPMEVILPSKIVTLRCPTMVRRGRIRKDNQSYLPQIRNNCIYDYDVHALQQWVLEIYKQKIKGKNEI